jgi:glycosyltransferase involved in cell wall biosynthesis
LPSHQENFGISVVEALAAGVPVLLSDKVNIWPDIVEDRAGIVNADTADGTYRSMLELLGMPDQERRRMIQNGVSCFRSRYEMKRTVKVLNNLF